MTTENDAGMIYLFWCYSSQCWSQKREKAASFFRSEDWFGSNSSRASVALA